MKIPHRVAQPWVRFCCLLLLSLGLTVSIGELWPQVVQAQVVQAQLPTAQQSTERAIASDIPQRLQQGMEFYDRGQYEDAIQVWSDLLGVLGHTHDNLTQALAFNYVSLAYQQQGHWDAARTSLATAFEFLAQSEHQDNDVGYQSILARSLNTQGMMHWHDQELESALRSFQSSEATYRQLSDSEGVLLTVLNQAQIWQRLGLNQQVHDRLDTLVADLVQPSRSPDLQAMGFWQLGNAQRRLGYLERAIASLTTSLDIAQQHDLSHLYAPIQLDLGNTNRAQGDRASSIGQPESVAIHYATALEFYQAAALSETSTLETVQIYTNQLGLLIHQGDISQAAIAWTQIEPLLANLPPGRSSIFAYLNLAHHLTCWQRLQSTEIPNCSAQIGEDTVEVDRSNALISLPSWEAIAQILSEAIQQARELSDLRAESYALGQLGNVYRLLGQFSEAQDLTQQALLSADASPDIRYRWEWQQGRLLAAQGQRERAIAAYDRAFDTLKTVRRDLLTIDSEVQFSFRDNVEPVYREFVDLLIPSDAESLSEPPSLANLEKAVEVMDALQLAELENFLNCTFGQVNPEDANRSLPDRLSQLDPSVALIYSIVLPDRLSLLVKLPNAPIQVQLSPVSQPELEQTISRFQRALLAQNRPEDFFTTSQHLYDWLIRPLDPFLQENADLKTLVFISDGALRNIPLVSLYDGNEYVVEKPYAIALLPSLQLFDLRTPQRDQLRVLAAAVSEAQTVEGRTFNELPYVLEEVEAIQDIGIPATALINADFTSDRLKAYVDSREFSAVHLATHGNFSSDPDETYLMAYQELLQSDRLNNLLRTNTQDRSTHIDLLVMSACETAQGDNRATLGLAGLAVRAGALSTLSTLWQVNDASTATLMQEFYTRLATSDIGKAEALHQAQHHLFQQGYLRYDWSPYVLVGNWL